MITALLGSLALVVATAQPPVPPASPSSSPSPAPWVAPDTNWRVPVLMVGFAGFGGLGAPVFSVGLERVVVPDVVLVARGHFSSGAIVNSVGDRDVVSVSTSVFGGARYVLTPRQPVQISLGAGVGADVVYVESVGKRAPQFLTGEFGDMILSPLLRAAVFIGVDYELRPGLLLRGQVDALRAEWSTTGLFSESWSAFLLAEPAVGLVFAL